MGFFVDRGRQLRSSIPAVAAWALIFSTPLFTLADSAKRLPPEPAGVAASADFDATLPAAIEPWREYAVNLDRLFGPYGDWRQSTLSVDGTAAAVLPAAWMGRQPSSGYAAVLSPPSLPALASVHRLPTAVSSIQAR